jgi:LPPG:FO 2-phospho-L-lactate transferase
VVLAGGTGGAMLARGMLDVVGPDQLVVIANTGDDVEIYGAYVSPDPDLVTFWLADRIDERGWGIDGDTFQVMDALRRLSVDVWFNLGDEDFAIGIERARLLEHGTRLTAAHAAISAAVGAPGRVLPMSDSPVRTRVMAKGRWWPFQEFMIRGGGKGPVEDVDFRGAKNARPTPEIEDALATAEAIVIGIDPILAVHGMRAALRDAPAPKIAVSPLVAGRVVKGPTEAFMAWTGQPLSSDGIAAHYEDVIDGLIADSRAQRVPVLETDVLMDTPEARRRVAEDTLRFALALR